jgi:AraC-like DNA-binding protein
MSTATSGRLFFDTDKLPERHRFPAFREEVIRRYTALDIQTQDQSQFHGAIELQRAGSVDVGAFATAAATFDRAPQLVRDGDDGLIFMLCRSGVAYQTQRGYDQVLQAGEVIICDCGYSGGLHMAKDSRFWSVKVPRGKIAPLFPDVARFAGAKLQKDPSARQLLFGYLGAGLSVDFSDSSHLGALYDEHIVDLIALALGAKGEARELSEQRGGRAARRLEILREIEKCSRDSGLSAVTVALRLGITPRYVHLLLEETGKSFTHHLLEQRLNTAAAMLRDPELRHRRIATIAAEAGFTDLSYFNRAFRRHFGATPSDMREAARARR